MHTKGNWEWKKDSNLKDSGGISDTLDLVSEDEDESILACPINTNDGFVYAPNKANARLIAAAPDLLEALKNIENDNKHMPQTAWDMIQKAIAKAKGGE